MTDKGKSDTELLEQEGVLGRDQQEAEQGKALSRMTVGQALAPAKLDQRGIIHADMRDETALNSFRELRTTMMLRAKHNNFVAMVTAAKPGAGATHVAINLATAITMDPLKTALIVDCNWRSPAIHQRLDLEVSPGLLDFLDFPEDLGVKSIIKPTAIPRLRAIPIGVRDLHNQEYFSSVNMQLLIKMLKQRYPDRYIIIDAPTLKNSADARMLADLCDQAVVVIPYGRCTAHQVEDAVGKLDSEKVAGVILNRQPA